MSNKLLARSAITFSAENELMLTPEGEAYLRPDLGVHEYFELLRDNGCLGDARRVLAHAMPKRRALWWGLLCAFDVFRSHPAENVEAVLRGVADFIVLPDEGRRLRLRELVGLVRPQSPPHFLAQAAILSFGSLIDPPAQEVLPRRFLTGRLVGVSIYLASIARAPLHYRRQLEQYLDVGLDVARGANLWPAPSTPLAPVFVPELPALVLA